jgi:tetratricopeptide (TPR) repeat protein
MEQALAESKSRLVEQIKVCLKSGDYSHALDLVRGTEIGVASDAELLALEKLAQNGIKRTADANRLITESQELFAQQKAAEAIQLLRQAYELDKSNSLARAILANALVEHANSVVETDWLGAEKLANQALSINPAHPTGRAVLNRIVDQKKASSPEDWVSHARKLQSSGDLLGALAWVAEGLAVHPDDPKLQGIHDSIQRDQSARRRQARRRDLEDLRRMELEIIGAAENGTKQALAERIQALAAKYWTDGEMLAVANTLLHQLGLTPDDGSTGTRKNRGATVIFHVPRPGAAKPAQADTPTGESAATQAPTILPSQQGEAPTHPDSAAKSPVAIIASNKVATSTGSREVIAASAKPELHPTQIKEKASAAAAALNSARESEGRTRSSARSKQPSSSNWTIWVLACASAIIVVGATIIFAARFQHHIAPVAHTPAATPATAMSASTQSAPAISAPPEATEQSLPPSPTPSDDDAAKTAVENPPAESTRNVGTLLVVTGQDDASVFLDGKRRQATHAGQLQLTNLEARDYLVRVSKSGFQECPPQRVRIHKGGQAKLIFRLEPQPRFAGLSIRGGTPGTSVLIDQTPAGTIQTDGTLSLSSINPGDHAIELRKERFKPRQFKKHFVAGETIALAGTDIALEAAAGMLKIIFAPPDAKVAIAKPGELPTIVSTGVPLNLAAGTYTLTARTAERFTRTATLEISAGQSKTLDLSLAASGMSRWEDQAAWKHEGDSFVRKGGDFVLYGVVPTSGTFAFSAMATKGRLLQWVLNYTDSKNYVLFQMDDNNFYRSVIRNGQKTDEIKVPDKGEKKSYRTLHIRVSPTEIVHQIRHGDSWTVLDRWTPGANPSVGKFGFYIPGSDQVALTGFSHYADLNIH